MGTTYHVTVVAEQMDEPAIGARIASTLHNVDAAMTTYRDDSELMLLNAAPSNAWLSVSMPLYQVLQTSREVYGITGGAFDPTVGPLVRLWGFGPDEAVAKPDDEAIAAAKARIGFQYLEIDPERAYVRKLRDIELDLSAVAKGYAVDAVAAELDSYGFTRYLVEVGGEVRVRGDSPRGDAWRVAIEKPVLQQGEVQVALRLSGDAMATSGDYRNFRDFAGKRYSHEIDPVTGQPVQNKVVSVTVVAADCATADALATGLMAMGEEAAQALVLRDQLPVYMMLRNGDALDIWQSPAMTDYLESEVSQ
ncbi:MAG TPA: FAD:protein FMN transferase [Pseudomonadales bacterium]